MNSLDVLEERVRQALEVFTAECGLEVEEIEIHNFKRFADSMSFKFVTKTKWLAPQQDMVTPPKTCGFIIHPQLDLGGRAVCCNLPPHKGGEHRYDWKL